MCDVEVGGEESREQWVHCGASPLSVARQAERQGEWASFSHSHVVNMALEGGSDLSIILKRKVITTTACNCYFTAETSSWKKKSLRVL